MQNCVRPSPSIRAYSRYVFNNINLFIYILQIVGLTLIIVPVYSKISAVFTSWPIVGGAIACGVFMMLMSIAGIYGAIKHHQIILFFVSFINALDFCWLRMYHKVIIIIICHMLCTLNKKED